MGCLVVLVKPDCPGAPKETLTRDQCSFLILLLERAVYFPTVTVTVRRGIATSHFRRRVWPGRASRRQARRADDEVVNVALEVGNRPIFTVRTNPKRGLPSRWAVVPGVGHTPPFLSIPDEAHRAPASLEA